MDVLSSSLGFFSSSRNPVPVVAPGQARLRVIIHAHNTKERFVNALYARVQEMTNIEAGTAVEPVTKGGKGSLRLDETGAGEWVWNGVIRADGTGCVVV